MNPETIDGLKERNLWLESQIAKEKAKNKKLHEALCFYACHSIQGDNFVLKNGIATQKTAREALKEVGEV
jgi:hypothetical protein